MPRAPVPKTRKNSDSAAPAKTRPTRKAAAAATAANADEGKAKRRAKKDPSAPKRALSAYMFFSQDKRNSVKEENPDIAFGDIGKVLGKMWREMDDSEKQPYVEKAAEDKKRYEAEKARAAPAAAAA
ncbi:Non-histone chromosomal protein 6 [Coemansia sp. RSA 552]|nr:Non-histone chromosomal protein 6 [Coemansia sp. RSA 552]